MKKFQVNDSGVVEVIKGERRRGGGGGVDVIEGGKGRERGGGRKGGREGWGGVRNGRERWGGEEREAGERKNKWGRERE